MNEPTARQFVAIIPQTAFEAHAFLRHAPNEKVYENAFRNRLRKKNFSVD